MRIILAFLIFAAGVFAQTFAGGAQTSEGAVNYFVGTSADGLAYTGSLTGRPLGSYQSGACFIMQTSTANTGAVTVNIDSVGVKSVKQTDLTDLVAGQIKANGVVFMCYTGSVMQAIGIDAASVGAPAPYIATFSSPSDTWSVTGATHGLGANIEIFLQEDGSTVWTPLTAPAAITKSNGNIVVKFAEATAGRMLISQLQGSTAGAPASSGSFTFNGRPSPVSPASGDYPSNFITRDATSDISALDVEAALAEIYAEKSSTSHTHTASAITFSPTGSLASTTVQTAIEELLNEKAASSHTHTPSDFPSGALPTSTYSSLPSAASYTNQVYVVTDCDAQNCTSGGGSFHVTMVSDGSVWKPSAGDGGSAGSTLRIMDEGTLRTARTYLNFIGAAVSCADNSGADRTDCTISGSSGSGPAGPLVVASDGTFDGERVFAVGAGILRFDGGANSVFRIESDCSYIACQGDDNRLTGQNQVNVSWLADSWTPDTSNPPSSYQLVTWTGDPAVARKAATSSGSNLAGICVAPCSGTSVQVAYSGRHLCTFASTPTVGNWVILSDATAGYCKDAATTTKPASGVVGVVDSATPSAGAYWVRLMLR